MEGLSLPAATVTLMPSSAMRMRPLMPRRVPVGQKVHWQTRREEKRGEGKGGGGWANRGPAAAVQGCACRRLHTCVACYRSITARHRVGVLVEEQHVSHVSGGRCGGGEGLRWRGVLIAVEGSAYCGGGEGLRWRGVLIAVEGTAYCGGGECLLRWRGVLIAVEGSAYCGGGECLLRWRGVLIAVEEEERDED
jgi:hypothetical protein